MIAILHHLQNALPGLLLGTTAWLLFARRQASRPTRLADRRAACTRGLLGAGLIAAGTLVPGALASNGWTGSAVGSAAAPATPGPPWLGLAFAGLACASLVRLLVLLARLGELWKSGTALPEGVDAELRALGGTDHPCRCHPALSRPICFGLGRGRILLPTAILTGSRESIRAVLAHEVAHLRLHHARERALLAIVALPIGWHPLFRALEREHRALGERLADERATRGTDRRAYVRGFLDLFDRLSGRGAGPWTAVAEAATDDAQRLRALLLRSTPEPTRESGSARRRGQLALLGVAAPIAFLLGPALPPRAEVRPEGVYAAFDGIEATELGTFLVKLSEQGLDVGSVEMARRPAGSAPLFDVVVELHPRAPADETGQPSARFERILAGHRETRAKKADRTR